VDAPFPSFICGDHRHVRGLPACRRATPRRRRRSRLAAHGGDRDGQARPLVRLFPWTSSGGPGCWIDGKGQPYAKRTAWCRAPSPSTPAGRPAARSEIGVARMGPPRGNQPGWGSGASPVGDAGEGQEESGAAARVSCEVWSSVQWWATERWGFQVELGPGSMRFSSLDGSSTSCNFETGSRWIDEACLLGTWDASVVIMAIVILLLQDYAIHCLLPYEKFPVSTSTLFPTQLNVCLWKQQDCFTVVLIQFVCMAKKITCLVMPKIRFL
jgi:hypothetical protein